jgi:exonuclease VII large subunit
VLERGYAVAIDASGRVLKTRSAFVDQMPFRLRVSDGEVPARAESE